MALENLTDAESEEPIGGGLPTAEPPLTKTKRQSFGGLRRQLSEAELSGPGVQKMLLDEIDRLDGELAQMINIDGKFHSADKDVAVLREKFKSHTALELISTASLTIGSIGVGLVYGIKENPTFAWIVLVGGALLIIVGLWAKKVKL